MVPGLFAAEGIFGLYALTVPHPDSPAATAVTAVEFTLRVIFTIGAIGTALSITTHILPNRDQGEMTKKLGKGLTTSVDVHEGPVGVRHGRGADV